MKKSMNRISRLAVTERAASLMIAVSLSAMVFALGTLQASAATVTYIVGTCKSGTQFSKIQSALNASPAPTTVEVCPGLYNEQITISKPVTLEGISVGNGDQVLIYTPGGGLMVNAEVYTGDPVLDPAAAQIYVNNVMGDVNLSNLVVNSTASGQAGTGVFLIGILYQGTSGTINHVVTLDQNTAGTIGWGVFLEGGSSNPSVTVENSSLSNFSQGGIWAIGTTDTPNLTVSIKSNVVSSATQTTFNIVAEESTNATVASNFVSGGLYGIYALAPGGSITNNTIFGSQYGIGLVVDGPLVKSNNIDGTVVAGINIGAPSLKVSAVENNTIKNVTNPNQGGGIGINLNCQNISSNQVHTNTIIDALFGYGEAPAGFAGSNTYFDVSSRIDLTSCERNVSSNSSATALQSSLKAWRQR
jgi:hypothetical protein